jgi:HK97 family phage portal protein
MSIFDRFTKKALPSRLWQAILWGRDWTEYSRWDKRKLIEQGYERNAPFYAACNIIAQTVADIPIYVDSHKNGKVIQTTSHPLLSMLERDMSRTEFIERLTLYLIVTGEAYAQIVFSERPKRPLGLITVPSQNMNPIAGDYKNPIAGFEYEDKKMIRFDTKEIIYISRPSLRDYFNGFSAGVPLSELIDLNNAAIQWNKNVALSGGIPLLVAKGPSLTKEEANRVRDAWSDQSGAQNSHRLKFISENIELQKLNDKPHDAEWSKAVEQSMRMIFMAFGVSSELMNDAGNKTYCLPYDASVATPTGRKRIGEIKAGDRVYSLDVDNGSVVESNVVWQGKTGHEMTYIAKGRGFKLEATANHPVLVLDKTVGEDGRHNPTPRYKRMDKLVKGDIIFKAFKYPDSAVATELPTLDVMESGIELATIVSVTEGAVQDVYDIEVEGTHNFIAENVVVHNSNYREARKALYMEASIPMARKIYGAITKALQKYYEDKPVICLDVDKIESIQEDRGFAVERLTKAVLAGILTANEAREELNYAPKPDGDTLRQTPSKTGPLNEDA